MAMDRDERKNRERKNLAKKWAEEQDKSGGASCIRIPEGVELVKLQPTGKEAFKFDFFPFIAGANNVRADEGEEAIDKVYEMHWVPTMSNKNKPIACRAFCFGKPCACCDWLRKHGGSGDQEFVNSLRAKRRHLWIGTDKPGQIKNTPLKLLDTNDKNKGMGFAELISDAIGTLDDSVDPFSFSDGCTAHIIVKEQTGGSFKYNGATRIDFRPRNYDYPSSLAKLIPCLDDLVIDPGYDEVMELLEPSVRGRTKDEDDDEDQDDDTPPARAARNGADDDEPKESDIEAGDTVEYEGETCKVKKVQANGKLLLIDSGGDPLRDIDPEDCIKAEETEPDEDDDEPVNQDDADDDQDDEEEEEKPQPRGRRTSRR